MMIQACADAALRRALLASCVQQPGRIPYRIDQRGQHLQRNEMIHARHKQSAGQEKEKDFSQLEKAPPCDQLSTRLQQPEGRKRRDKAQHAGQCQPPARPLRHACRDGSVQENDRLTALAGDGKSHQHQQAPPVGRLDILAGALLKLPLQAAAMAFHPVNHLDNQGAGSKRHDRLEPFLALVGQP
jgi:hypothetical protein